MRDAQGNTMAVYTQNDPAVNSGQFTLSEQHLYGSSRLGIYSPQTNLAAAPPPPSVPPPTPDPDHFCLTCFNGESSIHWKEGVGEMVAWLNKNPNYNLNIKADGNSTILRRGWDKGTGLFDGALLIGREHKASSGNYKLHLRQ